TFGRYQDGCVEDQPVVPGSFTWRRDRTRASSPAHALSGLRVRRSSFTTRPEVAATGPSWATTLPFRTTTNVSRLFSTSSRTSEKRRAASVAVSFFTVSDYQIQRVEAPIGYRKVRVDRPHRSRDSPRAWASSTTPPRRLYGC